MIRVWIPASAGMTNYVKKSELLHTGASFDKSEYMYYHENMQNQIITEFIKIMDRGMVVIPQSMRNKIGLQKGGYIKVILRNNVITLHPYVSSGESESSVKITKSSISKKEGLKILSKKTKKPMWTKDDDVFMRNGRAQIEKRLEEYNKV